VGVLVVKSDECDEDIFLDQGQVHNDKPYNFPYYK
jgi:hypothetical protein